MSADLFFRAPELMRDGKRPKDGKFDRDPGLLETNVPGIFVVGDVRHGSVKRVASGVGEGSVAISLRTSISQQGGLTMSETRIEGVGVPVPVSGAVESVIATSNSPADIIEALRRVHVFADLPEDQVEVVCRKRSDDRFAAGDILFRKGDRLTGWRSFLKEKCMPTVTIMPTTGTSTFREQVIQPAK
jgi:hypothetical protein